MEAVTGFTFLGSRITAGGECSLEIEKCPLEEKLWETRKHVKKQRHYFTHKGLSSQSYGFYSSHVRMLELDLKESWALKNWWFWIVVLEKTLASPLDSKEIKPVNLKGNQSWIFIGRTDAEAETPMGWLPDVAKELTHLKRLWCWERLKTGGEGDDRGWDGWMASLTRWTQVWASFSSWWWEAWYAAVHRVTKSRTRLSD